MGFLNINGLPQIKDQGNVKFDALSSWLKLYDIVCFVETRSRSASTFPSHFLDWHLLTILNPRARHGLAGEGLCLMARKWICPFVKATHSAFQPQIAWLVISGSFCALPSDLHLGFLYRSPTKDNDGFFSNLTAKVTEWSTGSTNRLIFGDWNVHVPKGSDSFTPIAHEFMGFLEANSFSLGTYTHGDSGEPTYGLPRPFTRPDHWIFDPGLPCPVLATVTPVDDGVCDHSALSCSIFIRKPPMLKALDLEKGKGCGLWGSQSASPPAEKLTHPGEDGWVNRVVPQNPPLRWKTTKGDLFCSKFRQILPNLLPRLSSCRVVGATDELIAHIRSTASHPHI